MDIHPSAEFLDILREKVSNGEYPSEEAVWREAIKTSLDCDEDEPLMGFDCRIR